MDTPGALRTPIPRPGLWPGLCTLLLAVVALSGTVFSSESPVAAEQWRTLRLGEVPARREAALWLARHGGMESMPALLEALRDPEPQVRFLAENAIWSIWMRSGDAGIDERTREGAELLHQERFEEALAIFEDVVRRRPDFAEGYNKRATALYYLGDYERSLADIAETLKRNATHFGALSGAGLCWMALGDPDAALPYFERALALNPNLGGIAEAVQQLKRRARARTL
jgi:tetratricopeptide (TPR) repeat protein